MINNLAFKNPPPLTMLLYNSLKNYAIFLRKTVGVFIDLSKAFHPTENNTLFFNQTEKSSSLQI